ncbi:ROK family transcriptional regulator [Blautia stercoris]|uniref:ROK family transcriptional regulator n=1 Tax=Blautia stercoris TaxID=871664 RepID=UPI00355AF817
MSERGVTTITLKQINKEKVYQYIYRTKQTSKLQIVQDLKMGLSTVSQNLNVLEEEGLIQRDGYFESTGGRKAQVIQIVSDVRISIGIGILKKMFYIVAIDLYGKVIAKDTIDLDYSDTEEYYEKVANKIDEFIEEYKYQKERILGVSIATQGIISPDGSRVMYGTIMNNVKMRLSDFSSKLPYPCRLVHDSKAAAYLELWNHSELDSAVVFLLNRNLGGAIITNRKVHEGSFMHSGVIEHICINSDGPLCYCGNRGCLETYCSANSLSEIAGMSIKEFFEKLRENKEENIKQIWKEYLKHLAFAMRNLNLVVDGPIIISGYLAPYFMENDLNYLLKQINSSLPFEFPKENLIVGTNGQYTPAIGAALFYVKKFIDGIAPMI